MSGNKRTLQIDRYVTRWVDIPGSISSPEIEKALENSFRQTNEAKEMSEAEALRIEVAKAIGRSIWGSEIEPKGNWLKAADAVIEICGDYFAELEHRCAHEP